MRRGEVREWKCSQGHVLGLVKRNGRGIRQLMLYRHALGEQAEVDVMAVVEGLVMDVRCDICECIRTWAPGPESITRRSNNG